MKVLICEDDQVISSLLQDRFEGEGIEVLQAFTMQEAKEMVDKHPDIKVVSMDGAVPLIQGGMAHSTAPLVEHILAHRTDLGGKIFALAGNLDNRDRIILAGATGVPGRRHQDDKEGVIKPDLGPVIEAVIKACKG